MSENTDYRDGHADGKRLALMELVGPFTVTLTRNANPTPYEQGFSYGYREQTALLDYDKGHK